MFLVSIVLLDKQTAGVGVSYSSGRLEFDPSLVAAARAIYDTFYQVHPEVVERPLGAAMNRFTYRGKLIFTRLPALLPQECFIPFDVIDRA
jgi:hypothetical protein